MYSVGDLVQPRMGGPKLRIVAVGEDHIVAVQASNAEVLPDWRSLRECCR